MYLGNLASNSKQKCLIYSAVPQNLRHQCPLRSLQQVDGMPGFRCCKCDTNYISLSDTEKEKKSPGDFSICRQLAFVIC